MATQVGVAAGSGVNFVSTEEVQKAAQEAGLDEATTQALVEDYEPAELSALKAGLLAAGLLALISLAFTRELPHSRPPRREKAAPAVSNSLTGSKAMRPSGASSEAGRTRDCTIGHRQCQ